MMPSSAFPPNTGEDHALKTQLPVLDLGHVFEFGGETCYTPQRPSLLKVLLLAVVLGVFLFEI